MEMSCHLQKTNKTPLWTGEHLWCCTGFHGAILKLTQINFDTKSVKKQIIIGYLHNGCASRGSPVRHSQVDYGRLRL